MIDVKPDFNEIVFVLDRSGSMSGLENDTIGGYNSFLNQQKQSGTKAVISTVLFDHEIQILHDRLPISDIKELTAKDYQPRGCTALLDAVGGSVSHIHKLHKKLATADRPAKTIIVIITDGYENSSKNYTYKKVKDMLSKRQEQDGWEFVFLGANIDAAAEAESFGISRKRAVNYKADSEGTLKNFAMLSSAMLCFNAGADFDKAFEEKRALVDEDVKRRGK